MTAAASNPGSHSASELLDKSVLDVVVRMPKTLSPRATAAEARAALEDDHVHMLVITDGGRLLGTLVREDLAAPVVATDLALERAVVDDRTIRPDVGAEEARRVMLERGVRRLAVVDDDGMLLGLLCLKRRLTGFCSDDDVRARAEDVQASAGGQGAAVSEVLRNR